jgi:hypothetical protein
MHSVRYSAGASEGSEAESDGGDADNPYPLEGKYKDEADRQRFVIRKYQYFVLN